MVYLLLRIGFFLNLDQWLCSFAIHPSTIGLLWSGCDIFHIGYFGWCFFAYVFIRWYMLIFSKFICQEQSNWFTLLPKDISSRHGDASGYHGQCHGSFCFSPSQSTTSLCCFRVLLILVADLKTGYKFIYHVSPSDATSLLCGQIDIKRYRFFDSWWVETMKYRS